MAYSTLITGPERRRRWSETEKTALVAAAFSPGAKVAEVMPVADRTADGKLVESKGS